jgi:hypothetical protein
MVITTELTFGPNATAPRTPKAAPATAQIPAEGRHDAMGSEVGAQNGDA